jgi:hypothetical protein
VTPTARPESSSVQAVVFIQRERYCSLRYERTALRGQARQLVGRETFAQERGESVVRRSLDERAYVFVSDQRCVDVAFEYARARMVTAQGKDERQMLDRNGSQRTVRLARGLNPDRLACRPSRTGKIVDSSEVTRKVPELIATVPIVIPHQVKRLAGQLDRSLCQATRVLDYRKVH